MKVARRVDAREFRSMLSTFTDALDGDGGAAAAEARHDRRRLHVSELLDGMVAIDGLLDAESGAIVRTALERAIDPPTLGDGRSTAQRRADALVRVCEASAPALASGPGRAHRPSVTCVADIEVLERRSGPELVRRVRAEAARAGRLSAETLRRISCDAGIARVITDGPTQPLDVGRTTRTVAPSLWRALVVRDGGCVAPGCDRPPGWCDAHHRRHWADGGATALDNLELALPATPSRRRTKARRPSAPSSRPGALLVDELGHELERLGLLRADDHRGDAGARATRSSRSAMRSFGPSSATSSTSSYGTAAAASCFLPSR